MPPDATPLCIHANPVLTLPLRGSVCDSRKQPTPLVSIEGSYTVLRRVPNYRIDQTAKLFTINLPIA